MESGYSLERGEADRCVRNSDWLIWAASVHVCPTVPSVSLESEDCHGKTSGNESCLRDLFVGGRKGGCTGTGRAHKAEV